MDVQPLWHQRGVSGRWDRLEAQGADHPRSYKRTTEEVKKILADAESCAEDDVGER
jgi:hypothetical protein